MAGVTLGFLKYVLGLDTIAFRKGMTEAERDLVKLQKSFVAKGEQLKSLGKNLTAFVTLPIAGIAAAGIKEAQETQQAMAQVNAALASMGPVAGRTATQLKSVADALELKSTFEADEILRKVTANLLTFGNVSGQVFDRAQQSAVDLATRLGTDLQSATILVGKALNDPVKGLTALSKAGIQFSAAQKTAIKQMVETGNVAGAQTIILGELERQFKGSAEAAANTDPLNQANKAWKQMAETIGQALLPILPAIRDAVVAVSNAFTSLPRSAQATIIVLGGIAAAIGPALIALGSLTTLLAPLAAQITTAAAAAGGFVPLLAGLGPALGVVAAAALGVYVAYQNWDKIDPFIQGVVDRTTKGASDINAKLRSIQTAADDLDKRLGIPSKDEFIQSIVSGVQGAVAKINGFLAAIQKGAADFDAAVVRAFQSAGAAIQKFVANVGSYLRGLQAPFDWVRNKAKEVGDAFANLYDRVVGHSYVPDMVDEIGQHMARLDALMVQPVVKATGKAGEAFRALQERVASLLDRLFPEQAAQNQFNKDLQDLQAYAQAGKISVDELAEAVARLREQYTGFSRNPLPSEDITNPGAVDTSVDYEALGRFADSLGPKLGAINEQTDRWKASLSDIGSAVFQRIGDDLARVLDGSMKLKDVWKDLLAFGLQILSSPNGPLGSLFGGPRAAGGPVMPNKAYLVGERGPEIFMPANAGRIVSNENSRSMVRGMGSEPSVNNHFYGLTDVGGFRRNDAQITRQTKRSLGIA